MKYIVIYVVFSCVQMAHCPPQKQVINGQTYWTQCAVGMVRCTPDTLTAQYSNKADALKLIDSLGKHNSTPGLFARGEKPYIKLDSIKLKL